MHDVAIGTFVLIPGFEDEKFSDLARLIKTGRNRNSAIRAMRQVPKAHWVKGQAQALVDNLVAYASEIPVAYCTGPAALEAIALAKDLTALLPDEKAEAATKRLENLDVRVIAIGTVAHRMLYDKESITVEAGKPVEFRFSNTDAMPHNFAITLPGAMEEIGLLAEATARDSDAMARHYIPKSDKILVASRLLQPGESHAFIFIAPEKPGVYPYVCTYPGHWRRMYGALYVVADLDTYQENPEKYLAKHELPIQDELLELVGKGRQWQLDDILEFVQPLEAGRSFKVGQNAFTVSSCVSCHRMGKKEGLQVGPDLTQLDPKKKNAEHILRSLLNPSEKIEEKFQAHIFRLDSGKTVTGMILKETADKVIVIENPLAKTKPIVLATAEIEARKKSEMSIMPEGLANKLTREEILDLVAYVLSSGKKDDKLFQGGHEHHHNH